MNYTQRSIAAPIYDGTKTLVGINILKLLAALGVLLFHACMTSVADYYFCFNVGLCSFFVVTGYFLPAADGTLTLPRLRHSISKIFKLDMVAQIVFALLYFMKVYRETPELFADQFTSLRMWLNFLVVGDCFGMHLWYLHALLFALIVIYLAIRWDKTNWLLPLCVPFLLLSLVCGAYRFLLPPIEYHGLDVLEYYCVDRNFMGMALPFILAGVHIRLGEHRLPSPWKLLMLLAILGLLAWGEGAFIKSQIGITPHFNIILSYPVAVTLVALVVKMRWDATWMRPVSAYSATHTTSFYLWHPIILYFFAQNFLRENEAWILLIMLVLTVILSEIIVQIKAKLSKKIKK